MNTSGAWVLAAVVLAGLAVVVGLLVALSRADRRRIEDFGRQRGWVLKRVWWLPAYLVFGRSGVRKSYYRAVFVGDSGQEERRWFEATFRTDPVPSDGPWAKPK